jgi:hypothetical protein
VRRPQHHRNFCSLFGVTPKEVSHIISKLTAELTGKRRVAKVWG